ncbi:integral membrane protein GPR137 [Poecilia latipinna]|uniref:G protein-coupled receptor 137 n=1 Tax=Poecilia latipinna TaxID=48699 RepID=A0A3B3V8J1_9TELE|nr:PREDICTED: integral membrane protein GPR137-like [Poecilia latipinna]XP_014905043.1 PREDICTED: integral membrane protein GPR137-like [Poecilia latipinna]
MEAPVTAASPPPNSNFSSSPPTPLRPAVAPSVQLGFTALYIALYGSLFLVVYVQLWLLFVYKHKRWSYQSLFLFLCLLWAGLRTTLFSFYFHNTAQANHLPTAAFWLLYCSPVCLQFFTFSLINLYFTQVFLKISAASDTKLWVARCAYAAMSVIFLCINVTCAALGERGSSGEKGKRTWKLVLVRVIVNDLLFIMEAVLLAATLLLLTRQPRSFSPYLMSKGTTVCRTAALGAVVIFLFFSRACYNLTVLFLSQNYKVESFDYDWYNVSDQADLQSELGDRGYLAFGAILFIWELLPTSLLILFFRVRWPAQETSSLDINNRVLPRPYFFDDPEGSDDEIPAPWDRSPTQNQSWYGSETAPLLFANNPADHSHQHHSFYSTPQN